MTTILNWIVKGLMQWLYGLTWQMGEYIMNALMDVFSMDMGYFKTAVPVAETIMNIMFGVGWALLLGNLVFQAAKSMMTGIGFEGEDPAILGMRSMVFAFLLVCSRQICELGLSLGATVVDLLQVPSSVIPPSLEEDMFGIDASWLLMMIVGIIILFQLVKFFFEVGERYVIVGVLTFLSPLAFAMGGSKNTMDIFKGWVRMYGSMCLMLVMNVVFMKLIISAMAVFPHGLEVFPWLILIIALARVARKIDSIIARIGLNPAITGDGLGRGFPGMLALFAGKYIASSIIGSQRAAGVNVAHGAGRKDSTSAHLSAPSPINTDAASGSTPTSHSVNTGFSGNTSSTNTSSTSIASPIGTTAVNPPIGWKETSQQSKLSRPAGMRQNTPPNVFSGGSRKTGIPVTVDDIPAHNASDAGSSAKRPQETAQRSEHISPSRPPRGSVDTKPIGRTVTTAQPPEPHNSSNSKHTVPLSTPPAPIATVPQSQSASKQQSSSQSQATQQSAPSQQSAQQNTQTLTRITGNAAPLPVQTHAATTGSAGTMVQAGNPTNSNSATQKVKMPTSADLRSQSKSVGTRQDKTSTSTKKAGKSQAPVPVKVKSNGGGKK